MAELPYDLGPREARAGLQEYSCSAYWIRNLQSFVSRAPVSQVLLFSPTMCPQSVCSFKQRVLIWGYGKDARLWSYSDPVSVSSVFGTSALRLGTPQQFRQYCPKSRRREKPPFKARPALALSAPSHALQSTPQ